MRRLPKIGVLGLSLKLHDSMSPGLKEDRGRFIKKTVDSMKEIAKFQYPGPCNTRKQVSDTLDKFKSMNLDGVLVVFLTYAPSLISLNALRRTKLPFVIWNTQEAEGVMPDDDTSVLMKNHGVHGVQDLCCVFTRVGETFHIVSGHYKDSDAIEELKNVFNVFKAASVIKNSNIGVTGYSMQDMGDFNVDETMLTSSIGSSVIHIDVNELGDYIKKVPENEIKKTIESDKKMFIIDNDVTRDEHEASARMEWGIRKLIERYSLDAWCQHFKVLNNSDKIPCQPYLAVSKLMGEGIYYAAEGDVTAAAACILMDCICGFAAFTEMFTIDFNDSAIFMRHIGELNISMARKDRPVKVIAKKPNVPGKTRPLTPVFSLKPGEATILSLTTGKGGRIKLVVCEGEILDTPEYANMNSPHFKWKPDGELKEFMNSYCKAGGSHHQALGYGKHSKNIRIFAELMNLEVEIL